MDMLIGAMGPVTSDNTTDWVNRHQEQLHYAYQRASDSLQKAAGKNKRHYDQTAQDALFLPGERVLVLDQRRQQKRKLSDRWEEKPYVVVSQLHPGRPVYIIRPEVKEGPERSLHRKTSEIRLPAWGLMVPIGGLGPEQDPRPEPRRSQRSTRGTLPRRYD